MVVGRGYFSQDSSHSENVASARRVASDCFFKQETNWMICLTCVVRGQADPVFIFKDEDKSEQDFKIKYNMYRY